MIALQHRSARIHFKLKLVSGARYQPAILYARSSLNANAFAAMLSCPIGGHAACPISGNFGVAAIGIDETGIDIGSVISRFDPLHTIGTYAGVPIANPFAESSNIWGSIFQFEDQEIVSAAMR